MDSDLHCRAPEKSLAGFGHFSATFEPTKPAAQAERPA